MHIFIYSCVSTYIIFLSTSLGPVKNGKRDSKLTSFSVYEEHFLTWKFSNDLKFWKDVFRIYIKKKFTASEFRLFKSPPLHFFNEREYIKTYSKIYILKDFMKHFIFYFKIGELCKLFTFFLDTCISNRITKRYFF